jgi:hypothetical protein
MATMRTTTAASASLSRDETGRLCGQTMGLVALTAGLFALGASIGRHISGGWAIRLRRTEDIRTAPLLAASTFLDILNVFLLFLSTFSGDDE